MYMGFVDAQIQENANAMTKEEAPAGDLFQGECT
jgi:hypothetical protein